MREVDVVVVGGGIVGLATAHAILERHPDRHVVVLEKEDRLAAHQTGRNSGVIHSGIYYAPGSFKARFAVAGARAMERFADAHGVAWEQCGKVIVATRDDEIPRLEALHERGLANGVPNSRISLDELAEREPFVQGVAALHVPSTGIIDYVGVCDALAAAITAAGGDVRCGARVDGFRRRDRDVVVDVDLGGDGVGSFAARHVVNCAGLQSDRVAGLAGTDVDVRIVPFRGEYYELRPDARDLVRHLIYPVPDPEFPFLGVHFTRMIDGGRECGPNAVLALAREGYTWRQFDRRDLAETLRFPGFRTLARRHWRNGLGEMHRSLSKRAFVRALQRLVPAVTAADLEPAPSGIRAQALRVDGALVDDFAVADDGRVVNVLNAPSPAATAALPIGEHIAGLLGDRLAEAAS